MHKIKNNSKNDQHLNFYGLKLQVKKIPKAGPSLMHRTEILVLQRQRQADLREFEASLTYIASSWPMKTT